jgi:hypothetical protein
MAHLIKRDANHGQIRAALVAAGVAVFDAAYAGRGMSDLLARHRDGRVMLLEVKRDKRATLTEAEHDFAALFPEAYVIVTTPEEALAAVGLLDASQLGTRNEAS